MNRPYNNQTVATNLRRLINPDKLEILLNSTAITQYPIVCTIWINNWSNQLENSFTNHYDYCLFLVLPEKENKQIMAEKQKYASNVNLDMIIVYVRYGVNDRKKICELSINRNDRWTVKLKKEIDNAIRRTWIDFLNKKCIQLQEPTIEENDFKDKLKQIKAWLLELSKSMYLTEDELKLLKDWINIEINNSQNNIKFLGYMVQRLAEYAKRDDLSKLNKVNYYYDMTNDTFHQSNDELDAKNEKYRNEVLEQLRKNKLKVKITYNIEDLMKYLRAVIKLKADKPLIYYYNYKQLAFVPYFQPLSLEHCYVLDQVKEDLDEKGKVRNFCVFKCFMKQQCNSSFYIIYENPMELKWIEFHHADCPHAFEHMRNLDDINFSEEECRDLGIDEIKILISEIIINERNIDPEGIFEKLQKDLQGKECLIPNKKLLTSMVKEIREKLNSQIKKEMNNYCINSTTHNGKKFGRKSVMMRSSDGIESIFCFGSLFQTGRIIKSKIVDVLQLNVSLMTDPEFLPKGFTALLMFNIFEPDAKFFVSVYYILINKVTLKSMYNAINCFKEVLLEDGGYIWSEFYPYKIFYDPDPHLYVTLKNLYPQSQLYLNYYGFIYNVDMITKRFTKYIGDLSSYATKIRGYMRLLPFLKNEDKYLRFKSIRNFFENLNFQNKLIFDEFMCKLFVAETSYWNLEYVKECTEEEQMDFLLACNCSEYVVEEFKKKIKQMAVTINLNAFIDALTSLEAQYFKEYSNIITAQDEVNSSVPMFMRETKILSYIFENVKVIQNNQVDFIVDEEEEVDCKLKVDAEATATLPTNTQPNATKPDDAMSDMNMDMFD